MQILEKMSQRGFKSIRYKNLNGIFFDPHEKKRLTEIFICCIIVSEQMAVLCTAKANTVQAHGTQAEET